MMKPSALAALMLFVVNTASAAGERVLCHLEPLSADGWHYRTKIDGRSERCWYVGERMKARRLLYWSETPTLAPPMSQSGEFELRWKGETK
jgi:hypothetical protein